MGVNPFYNIPKFSIDTSRPIIPPKGYPANPSTIGEHIRKKRLDGNLILSDIAKIVGVSESNHLELGKWNTAWRKTRA